jgi:NO-binding membrane sensor protein with MHYT domain
MLDTALTGNAVTGNYDYGLVCLSYIISVIASFTALNLSLRIGESFGLARKVWIAGCAFAMGCGIWSMHFTAMLAYKLPFEVTYNIGITLFSLVIAVFASGCGLVLANKKHSSKLNIALAGLIMGIGVALMHFSGMMAMEFNGAMHFRSDLFLVSILIAIFAASAALWLIIHFSKKQPNLKTNLKRVAAFIMGFAITGMHYTGMAATHFIPQGTLLPSYQTTADIRLFAFGISGVTLLILGLTIAASITQKEFNLLRGLKNDLEKRVSERTKELEVLSTFPFESPDPVFRIDQQNTIIYSNPSGLSILREWGTNVGEKFPSLFMEVLSETRNYKKQKIIESSLHHQIFEFSIIYVEKMNYLNIYGRNITKQKMAETEIANNTKELERSNNALQEFASMASHDLQEPLRKIYIFGDQLKKRIGNLDQQSEGYLNRMQRAASRMQSLIMDLLKYSQVNTQTEPFRRINLRKIVDEVRTAEQ